MKRYYFLILLLALMPFIAQAQNYKPLPPVDVPEFPTNNINISERETFADATYYTASHALASRAFSLTLEYPPKIDMSLHIDTPINTDCLAKLYVGGVNYLLWHIDVFEEPDRKDSRVYIDIQKII